MVTIPQPIVKVTGEGLEPTNFDLSNFSAATDTVDVIATTTSPGGSVPDWAQHSQVLKLTTRSARKLIEANLYPKSVYTFVVEGVFR